jgi:hypothetical protein
MELYSLPRGIQHRRDTVDVISKAQGVSRNGIQCGGALLVLVLVVSAITQPFLAAIITVVPTGFLLKDAKHDIV